MYICIYASIFVYLCVHKCTYVLFCVYVIKMVPLPKRKVEQPMMYKVCLCIHIYIYVKVCILRKYNQNM